MADAKRYRVQQFAKLAGVTVRTLHHYDRLGLLRPQRNSSGFRIYAPEDLDRLEQIVALRFIGLPLKQIGNVLAGNVADLAGALGCQIKALEEKKRRLEVTITTIRQAEATLLSGAKPNLRHIVEVIEMQSDHDWILGHFRESVRPAARDRLASLTPDVQEQMQRDWSTLGNDIASTLDEDPGTPTAQALLERWESLVRGLVGDEQELVHGLKSLYADRENWPKNLRIRMAPLLSDRVLEFLKRAVAARRR